MIKAFCDMCECEIKKNEKIIRVIGELRSEIMGERATPSAPGRWLNMEGIYFCSVKCASEYMRRWAILEHERNL